MGRAAMCQHRNRPDDPPAPATEIVSRVDSLRHQIATLPPDAPLADWGRWVLDDRPDRPIAPGFTITPAEADQLAAGNGGTNEKL